MAGYLVLKRPADKSCAEPCTIETTTSTGPVIKTVNWPFYGRDQERTRYLDAPHVKPPFATRWTFKGRRLLEYSPIAVGGAIYGMNNNGLVFSIKKRTGKARWTREIATRNASAPAYGNHMLFISNLDPGQVIAIATKNGRTVWRRSLPGRTESSPVVVGNMVIVGLRVRDPLRLRPGDGQDHLADTARRRDQGGAGDRQRSRLRRGLLRGR